MKVALEASKQARKNNEVPVGAVVIKDNELLSVGFNQVIANNDPTAHAELVALRQASKKLKNYTLPTFTKKIFRYLESNK